MSSTKKKAAGAIAAVGVAAAMALGGTFAWQSISQTALNEASDVVNPGGRLHDDFYIDANGGYNADVYVENFADEEIFARVQLQEFMEVVVNRGTAAETSKVIVGSKTLKDDAVVDPESNPTGKNLYDYAYVTHLFGGVDSDLGTPVNATDEFWTWTMGGPGSAEVWYMPTFNKNKDSLVADRNGMYVDRIGGISSRGQQQYQDAQGANTWTVWAAGDTKEDRAIYDVDANSADEVGYDFENLDKYTDNVTAVKETHAAAKVGEAKGLISMAEWMALNGGTYSEETHGGYWVYDVDGWVYWSSPIGKGEATGLLLDSVELNGVMDDTWYYAINAVGQFVTADDSGKSDDTGFYDTTSGSTVPTANAETLLGLIGVDVTEEKVAYDLGFNVKAPSDLKEIGSIFSGESNWVIYHGELDDAETSSAEEWIVTPTLKQGEVAAAADGVAFTYEVDDQDADFNNPNSLSYKIEDKGGSGSLTVNDGSFYVLPVKVTAKDADGNVLASKTVDICRAVPIRIALCDENGNVSAGDNSDSCSIGLNESVYVKVVSDYSYPENEFGNSHLVGFTIDSCMEDSVNLESRGNDVWKVTHSAACKESCGDSRLYAVANATGLVSADYFTFACSRIGVSVGQMDNIGPYARAITVSGLEDQSYPLTLKVYEVSGPEEDPSDPVLANTVEVSKTGEGLVRKETQAPPYESWLVVSLEESDGRLSIVHQFVPNDAKPVYVKAVATDALGNVGEVSFEVKSVAGCFVAGTKVQAEAGLVNIEDIQLGDRVRSFDFETGEVVLSPVTWVQGVRYIDATYAITAGGETIVTTYEHPFYVLGEGWVAAEDLSVGEELMDSAGNGAEIVSIVRTPLAEPVRVYNFTVGGTHNYLITSSGILVHNVQK